MSEVNNLRGKVDRSEKYEISDIDQLEAIVVEFADARADTRFWKPQALRANSERPMSSSAKLKRKRKSFYGLFPAAET